MKDQYRKHQSKGEYTKSGGPAVSVLPKYGNCSYCGLPLASRITDEECYVLGARVVFCDNPDCEDYHHENVVDTPVVEPEHLSLTVYGICSGCGAESEDMESDGWMTPDNYRTYLCPSCYHKGKCTHCGLTLRVQRVHAGSQYVGMYQVGQYLAQCTNPDCSERGYIFRAKVLDLTP